MKRIVIIAVILILGITASVLFDNLFFSQLGQEDELLAQVSVDETSAPPKTSDGEPDGEENPLTVGFSHESGFYDKNFSVVLSSTVEGADIYFTLDGSPPSEESPKYAEPISINVKSKVTAETVKAVAVKDGEVSRVVTQSYVYGKNVFDRFDSSTLVFVLSIDPYDLYDYYDGIANEGYLRDQYVQENGWFNVDPTSPANYNKRGKEEAERDVYVEVFDNEGNYLLNQAAGVRVSGGWSRDNDQKSLQLYARKEYGDSGKFKLSLFEGNVSLEGQLITKYDKIKLRNNGNDREFGAVRDELTQDLATQAGFPDTQSATPAAVFLNGEYYGFAWLKESYGNGYLEQHYGGNKDNYQIVSSTEKGGVGEDFAVEDYAYVYELAENGLTDDKKFEEFCSLVDIDNLMLYYAVQIYIDNKDWPNNNMKMYRYYADEDEEILNGFNDGKWRFLMYDVEYAWGLYGSGHKADTLYNVMNGVNHLGGKSVFLSSLLQREDMRQKFANTMCDLLDGAFETSNIISTLERLLGISENERLYALENGYTSDWANPDTFEENYANIRSFANKRHDVIRQSLSDNLDLGESMYTVLLTAPNGAEVSLNTRTLTRGGTVENSYYYECSVEIDVRAYFGYEFDSWDINGVIYHEEKMSVGSHMAIDGEVVITLNLKEHEGDGDIYISALHSGDNGWIELYNPGANDLTTADLYLSNDAENLKKWKIPTVNVYSKSELLIVCKNNNSEDALMKTQTNFNLKEGKTLYLSDEDGTVISYVNIIGMESGQELRRQIDGSYEVIVS